MNGISRVTNWHESKVTLIFIIAYILILKLEYYNCYQIF